MREYTIKNIDRESLDLIEQKYGELIEDIFPLSPGQAWMLGKTKQFTDVFLLQTVAKIKAPIDQAATEKLFRDFARERQNFRTAFVWRGLKQPYQVVLKERDPEITWIDRHDKTLKELSEEIDEFCAADRARGFDTELDPLFRVTFFMTVEKNISAVIISRPHLIEDGTSQGILFRDMFWNHLLKGKLSLTKLTAGSYGNYAKWLEDRDREKDLLYWKELLKDGTTTLLPHRIPSDQTPVMKTLTLRFTEEENRVIRKLPGRYNATLNSILHATWGLLLAGFTGKKDILFGTVTSGRSREVAGIDNMTGCFINAFPVRMEVREEESFGELARRLQTQILTSQEYAYIAPDELGRELGREEGYFDHLLNFYNFQGASEFVTTDNRLPEYALLDIATHDDLSTGFCLYFEMVKGELLCRFCYDANQFQEEQIRKLEETYGRMLRQILEDRERQLPCGKIRVIESVTDLLYTRRESDHTAMIFGQESMTYRQLVEDAEKIARGLMSLGVKKGDRILLIVRNSLNGMRGIYGILCAGGVFVASEITWPEERLRIMSEEAGVRLRLTDEMISDFLKAEPSDFPLPVVRGFDPAAIYYTSGSMGTPKGTVLHHRTIQAYACPDESMPEFRERKVSLTFPVFATLLTCASVLVVTAYEKTLVVATLQEMQSVELLAACIERNRVESIGGTPSLLLRLLMVPSFAKVFREQIKLLWLGGEMMKEDVANKLLYSMKDGVLDTVYGSSETYLISCLRYEPGKRISLDRIPKGVLLYTMNENLEPVPAGEEGEILIGGVPAQYGHYLNEELNQKKYVDHPVYGRLFRIGDYGRRELDGSITVLGRMDRMIKLNGLRIEPGEIEAAMEKFAGITRAAVALKQGQLCGYYTAEEAVDEQALRSFLSESLPYYMIPSRIIYLEKIILRGMGKLDYDALPDPEMTIVSDKRADADIEKETGKETEKEIEKESGKDTEKDIEKETGKEGSVEEGTEEKPGEELLCRIFGDVLKKGQPVGAEESFFTLGGDSIHALKMLSLLEKEGFTISLKDLFVSPTPRLLAPKLKPLAQNADHGGESSMPEKECKAFLFECASEEVRSAIQKVLSPDEVEAVYPATALVGYWMKNNRSRWPQSYCFEISADISPERIEKAMQDLCVKHTALRSMILPAGNGRYCQVVLKTPRSQFFKVDLSALSDGEGLSAKQKSYLSGLIRMEYSPMTELGGKILLRVGWIRISEEKALLYIGSSHLTIEGASVYRLFLELTGQAEAVPDAELMDRHFHRLMYGNRMEADSYWNNVLRGCRSYTELPKLTDTGAPGKRENCFAGCGSQLYKKAIDFCRDHQITPSALLCYSFGKSLMKNLSAKEVCFLVAGSGRSPSEIDLPGMFVLFFPLRLTQEDTILSCQKQLLGSAEHSWVWADPAYSDLGGAPVYLRSTHGSDAAEAEQIHLFMNIFGAEAAKDFLEGYAFSGGDGLGIYTETSDQISWDIMFDPSVYDPGRIRNLSAEWIRQLKLCVTTEND